MYMPNLYTFEILEKIKRLPSNISTLKPLSLIKFTNQDILNNQLEHYTLDIRIKIFSDFEYLKREAY